MHGSRYLLTPGETSWERALGEDLSRWPLSRVVLDAICHDPSPTDRSTLAALDKMLASLGPTPAVMRALPTFATRMSDLLRTAGANVNDAALGHALTTAASAVQSHTRRALGEDKNERRSSGGLYVILDVTPQTAPDVVLALAEQSIRGGASLLQLRCKGIGDRDVVTLLRSLMRITARRVPVLANDRADLALAAVTDGVHVGQTDVEPETARRILGVGAIIGQSTHSRAQAESAAVDPMLSYVAIGPIFESRTKRGHATPVGIEGFARIHQATKVNLCTIGGMDCPSRVAEARRAGARFVACVSAVQRASNPMDAARALALAWAVAVPEAT